MSRWSERRERRAARRREDDSREAAGTAEAERFVAEHFPGRVLEQEPFWSRHIGLLVWTGIGVFIGIMLVLVYAPWGPTVAMWGGLLLGFGGGGAWMIWMLIESHRETREKARVARIGGAIAAVGWGGFAIVLIGGFAVLALLGWDRFSWWGPLGVGVLAVCMGVLAPIGMELAAKAPLPALDRMPLTARVVLLTDNADDGQCILVEYRDARGEGHDAQLADLIDDSWEDRFAPGTTWQVYAFRDPALADSVVFLTEAHEDVWRDGYKLDGVRLGGEGGPVTPGPGSPFLREGSKWRFES